MKQVIGYTSGVFDILHIGHVNLLRNARALCDKLIVGVSTDDLVLEYKLKRPVMPFEYRIEIVRSLRYCDVAIPQTELNKQGIVKKLAIDVLFVGDDWYQNNYGGEKCGVPVVYLPHTLGVCSNNLREENNL